jgi:hypothetical protein
MTQTFGILLLGLLLRLLLLLLLFLGRRLLLLLGLLGFLSSRTGGRSVGNFVVFTL